MFSVRHLLRRRFGGFTDSRATSFLYCAVSFFSVESERERGTHTHIYTEKGGVCFTRDLSASRAEDNKKLLEKTGVRR